jgi:hypothetical protein
MDSTARGALAKVSAVTLGRWLIKILAKLIPQRPGEHPERGPKQT